MGSSTSQRLKERGYVPDFEGQSGNISKEAHRFHQLIRFNEKVLFPQSDISLKTIEKVLSDSQKMPLIVYATKKKNRIPTISCEVLIFTSPSNVTAFLSKNSISATQKVIAIGNSTADELSSHGISSKIAWAPKEIALSDLL